MKKLLKWLGFLGLIYVIGIFAAGFFVKHEHNRWLEQLEHNFPADRVKIIEQSYVQNFGASHAHFVVALSFDALKGELVYLNVDHHIRLGPWLGASDLGLAKINTTISFSSTHTERAVKAWVGESIATAETVIAFSQRWHSQVDMFPLHYFDETISFDFHGGRALVSDEAATLLIPYFAGKKGVAQTIAQEAHIELVKNSHNSLSIAVKADQITTVGFLGEGRQINFSDVLLNFNFERFSKALLHAQAKGSMLVTEGGENAQVEMTYEAQNIFEPALHRLRELNVTPYNFVDNDAVNTALLRLIEQKPNTTLSISMKQDNHEAYLRGNLDVEELSSSDQSSRNMALLLMMRGRADVQLNIPKVMVESKLLGDVLRLIVKNGVQRKALLDEGESYTGTYSYQMQTLRVNGEKVNLF